MLIAGLADLSATVAAGLALILTFALWLIVKLIVGGLSKIPVIGPWVASHLDPVLFLVRFGMQASLDAALHGMSQLWHVISHVTTGLFDQVRHTLWDLADAIWRIAYRVIPREISRAWNFTRTEFRQAEHQVTSLDGRVTKDLNGLISRFRHDWNKFWSGLTALIAAAAAKAASNLRHVITWTEGRLHAGDQAARRYASQALAAAQRDITLARDQLAWAITATYQAVESDIRAAELTAEHEAAKLADAAQAAAVHEIDHAAQLSMSDIWAGVSAGVTGLAGAAGTSFPEVTAMLKAIPSAAPATAAQAVAADAAALPPVYKLLTDCVIPNCDNLGTFGKDIAGLSELITGAAFLGMIIAMVTEPTATATATSDLLGKPSQDIITATAKLIGVS